MVGEAGTLFICTARLGLAAFLLATSTAVCNASATRLSPFMNVNGDAGRLIAQCLVRPDDCRSPGQSVEPVALTADKWAELVAVNNSVNAEVNAAGGPDVAQGGAIASLCQVDRDNCQARVLRKRSLLLNNGWPAASLLVTEVRQRNGDHHTVLTVVTDR